jgi:pimeloyl-ACP methyl ester carboxylesterase
MRVELHLAPGARETPHVTLMTLGGPIYCAQLRRLAQHIDASLVCTDYGPNRYEAPGQREGRLMDWGNPDYLAAVAKLPNRLRAQGVKISKLVLVGVSYSGYANAELVATHPELRPAALIVVDSYLDLPARYRALPVTHETHKEIERALGGTLEQRPQRYAARSPSHHLDGLAEAIRHRTALVVVWSISDAERREFAGATCSLTANAQWLADLALLLGKPVPGYVTRMRHAHALWDRGQALLELAGIAKATKPLPARRVLFPPSGKVPAASYCTPA